MKKIREGPPLDNHLKLPGIKEQFLVMLYMWMISSSALLGTQYSKTLLFA
jgi:hypothetical protein